MFFLRNDYASDEQLDRHASGIHSQRSDQTERHTDYIRDVSLPVPPPPPPPPVYRYPTRRHTPDSSISVVDSSMYSGHHSRYEEIEI